MEFFEQFVAVPALVVIVYLLAECVKAINGGALNKYIPIFCGIFGAVLGIVCYVAIKSYIPADNVVEAIAIGITSGFAATGVNQVFKQMSSDNKE